MKKREDGHFDFPVFWEDESVERPRLVLNPPACKSEDFYKDWNRKHRHCMICGIDATTAGWARWPGLETHHIIKQHRSHEATNLIRVCRRCHQLAEGFSMNLPINGVLYKFPPLTIANVIWCKLLADPEPVDLMRLSALHGRYVAKPEPFEHLVLAEKMDRTIEAKMTSKINLAWNHLYDSRHIGPPRPCFLGTIKIESFEKYIKPL